MPDLMETWVLIQESINDAYPAQADAILAGYESGNDEALGRAVRAAIADYQTQLEKLHATQK